jgi:hypothetical protein
VPGTAGEVELDNENGIVVWSVEDTATDDAATTDIRVDAGNGDVLAQDAGDDSESGESEADEANEAPEATEPAEAPNG